MSTDPIGLADDVSLHVDYEDRTPGGSALSRRADQLVRSVFAPAVQLIGKEGGHADAARQGPAVLRQVIESSAFGQVATRAGQGWEVRADLRYPVTDMVTPRTLTIGRRDGQGIRLDVPTAMWPAVHDLIAGLSGADATLGWLNSQPRELNDLVGALVAEHFVRPLDAHKDAVPKQPGYIALGHNTVLVRSDSASVVVDPLIFSASNADPVGYSPLPVRALGEVDAILITHSHPDHFAAASLLRWPRETMVIVPRVERETLLCFDMAHRARELGFQSVVVLDWWSSVRVKDITVTALPFYGEQPSETDVLHADVRNVGATYQVTTPETSAVFLADSGRDHLGDVKGVARDARSRLGPVEVVFSGYRGWTTYPVELLTSSVSRYLLFVPPTEWGARQSLMTSADEAVDVAELWGAQVLVPYADGGAPWHWKVGLGPALDGTGVEVVGFDPFPERVLQAAAKTARASNDSVIPSPVDVRILRPNDVMRPGSHSVTRLPGYAWPRAWSSAFGA